MVQKIISNFVSKDRKVKIKYLRSNQKHYKQRFYHFSSFQLKMQRKLRVENAHLGVYRLNWCR